LFYISYTSTKTNSRKNPKRKNPNEGVTYLLKTIIEQNIINKNKYQLHLFSNEIQT
jgi:hypothetical protein